MFLKKFILYPCSIQKKKKANRSTNMHHRKKENISSRHSIHTTRILFRYNPILDTVLNQDHDFQTKLTSIQISMNWHPWFPNNRNTLHRSIHIFMNWHPLRRGKQLNIAVPHKIYQFHSETEPFSNSVKYSYIWHDLSRLLFSSHAHVSPPI